MVLLDIVGIGPKLTYQESKRTFLVYTFCKDEQRALHIIRTYYIGMCMRAVFV